MSSSDWDDAFAAPSGDERRVHTRRVLRSGATLRFAGGKTIAVRTLDISVGGMGILVPISAPVGATFTVRLSLPMGSKPAVAFEARARVMHSVLSGSLGGFKVGLRFIDLSEDMTAVVQAFL